MKFVVAAFSGMAPRYADMLLDDIQASDAANLKVTNGSLRGFRGLEKVTNLLPPPGGVHRKVKKLYRPGTDEYLWWGHEAAMTCIVNGPLVNDAFDRVYITRPGNPPLVTTWDNIALGGSEYYILGVPRPGGAPGVSWGAGGTGSDPRAYVYTFRTDYGETGMPSDPNTVTVPLDLPITITVPAASSVGSHVVAVDIYRTATGGETAGDYFRVGTVTGATTTFVDSMALDQVPLQLPLTSDLFEAAPVDLQGICTHSSGALAGYSGNTVRFSEPYLPHAWPSDYSYTCPYKIVALAPFANTIVALTLGCPVVIAGNHPANLSISVMTDIEPCIAPRSVVSVDNSVYYASPNGLIQVNSQGLNRLTNNVLTREEWPRFITPDMCGVKYGSWYLAMIGTSQGFALALPPYEPTSLVRIDRHSDVTTLETDERNGDAILVQRTTVSRFDILSDRRITTSWKSKEFVAPYPINLGAFQLLFKGDERDQHELAVNDAQIAFNAERWAVAPLDTLNLYPIGGVVSPIELEVPSIPVPDEPQLIPPPTQPMGGEPLFGEVDKSTIINVRFALIADGVEVYSQPITDEGVHKLPSGFKATRFYATITGNAEVQRLVLAETAKECRTA